MFPSEVKPPALTILTPTWNRRNLLPRLYQTLLEQEVSPSSFEWLVVDDGSTDGTIEWLNSITSAAPFSIKVTRQENGGKHRAVNRGARHLISGWVTIIDSDDWVAPHGLLNALKQIETVDRKSEVLAIVSPNNLKGREMRRFDLPKHPVDFGQWLRQTQIGDTNILMRSAVMQAFPFPEYEGENFIAESSIFSSMFRNGGVVLSNDIIVEGEYQPDGLSSRSLALRVANPLGAMHSYAANLQAGVPFGRRVRCKINYHRFWWHASRTARKKRHIDNRVSIYWLLPGWLMYKRDLWQIREI